ncbi:MAG: DUF438 domain-containing protein, partial [Coriobacteriia bacterium]|nr:DUF438 domain-containing protein [Coriobacteriia bacterium]
MMTENMKNPNDRKRVIKEILTDLNDGKSLEDAREKFRATFTGVASSEIAAAEAELIGEGVPIEEVQRLCSVHAALFEGSLEEEPQVTLDIRDSTDLPGHPADTLRRENRAIEALCRQSIGPLLERFVGAGSDADDAQATASELIDTLSALADIKRHYQRKENLFFPYMERHGISAPPKVMWGVDDEIRAALSQATRAAGDAAADRAQTAEAIRAVIVAIDEMISKEENIMLPLVMEAFSTEEWERIAHESDDLGYCLIDTPPAWGDRGGSGLADAGADAAGAAPTATAQYSTGTITL